MKRVRQRRFDRFGGVTRAFWPILLNRASALIRSGGPSVPLCSQIGRMFGFGISFASLRRFWILSYLQYDGFLSDNLDCLPRGASEDGPREWTDVGDFAARRIGLILANDPEGLLPAVSPAKSDSHSERGATFVGRRRDHFRACAPRAPVTDFPLRGRRGMCVALIDCGPVCRLEAAESRLDRREAFLRHQVTMRGYGTIGEIGSPVFGVLDEGANS